MQKLKGIKILLVDDEPDMLQFLEMGLQDEGFEVQSAQDGMSAEGPICQCLLHFSGVKYFLSSSGGPGGGSSDVQAWILQNGKVVPQTEWQSTGTGNSSGGMGMNGSSTLYEVNSFN